MERSPDSYYPYLEWFCDGRKIHSELLNIGAKDPANCKWDFVTHMGAPDFAVVCGTIRLSVSFIRGDLIARTDIEF